MTAVRFRVYPEDRSLYWTVLDCKLPHASDRPKQ